MKIAFLVNCAPEKEEEVKQSLASLGYSCLPTTSAEEIRQTGRQLERLPLCFTDASTAYKFLKSEAFTEFTTLHLLFVPGRPKMSPEVEQKLREISLKIIAPSDGKLLQELIGGLENPQNQGNEPELEFLVHEKSGKKNAA